MSPVLYWVNHPEVDFTVRYYLPQCPDVSWKLTLKPDTTVVCTKNDEDPGPAHGYWERNYDTSLTIQWHPSGYISPNAQPEFFVLIAETSTYRKCHCTDVCFLIPVARNLQGPVFTGALVR